MRGVHFGIEGRVVKLADGEGDVVRISRGVCLPFTMEEFGQCRYGFDA
jgi:hypothetical protein